MANTLRKPLSVFIVLLALATMAMALAACGAPSSFEIKTNSGDIEVTAQNAAKDASGTSSLMLTADQQLEMTSDFSGSGSIDIDVLDSDNDVLASSTLAGKDSETLSLPSSSEYGIRISAKEGTTGTALIKVVDGEPTIDTLVDDIDLDVSGTSAAEYNLASAWVGMPDDDSMAYYYESADQASGAVLVYHVGTNSFERWLGVMEDAGNGKKTITDADTGDSITFSVSPMAGDDDGGIEFKADNGIKTGMSTSSIHEVGSVLDEISAYATQK